MVTSFRLSIGYLSGYMFDENYSEAYEKLKECALAYINGKQFAFDVAKVWGEYAANNDDFIEAYAFQYREKEYNPITFEDVNWNIFISCSGGGNSRALKERVALILCAYLIQEMAKQAIPICLNIS